MAADRAWLFLGALGLVVAVLVVGLVILRPGPVGTPFYLVLAIVTVYAVAHVTVRMGGREWLAEWLR